MFKEIIGIYKNAAKKTAEEMADTFESKPLAVLAAVVFPPYAWYKLANNVVETCAEGIASCSTSYESQCASQREVVFEEV